jgi:hypothetical protein
VRVHVASDRSPPTSRSTSEWYTLAG